MKQNSQDAPTPGALLDEVWDNLGRGVADRGAAARNVVLATVGGEGGAEARVVILREASRAQSRLAMHTDRASAKVAELGANPRATLLVWDPGTRMQIRLRVRITARAGTDGEWARVPDPSRLAYGGAPPPGTPIARPMAYCPGAERERFTVLTAEIDEIEVLVLRDPQHLRAVFRHSEGWQGAWLAP